MNAARISVEWSYKVIKQEFASQDFHRKLQVRKLPIGSLYIAAVLLRNFITCLGEVAQPSSFFSCRPPSLDRYLSCSE